MSIEDQLRINGYAVDATGVIETHRAPDTRWSHTHLAVIRIDAAEAKPSKEFIAKVLAAVDEPGALVGVGRTGTMLLFKVAAARDISRSLRESFVIEGKQCALVVTSDTQSLDVGAFTWRDNRSPLNTRRDELPPLFWDITTTFYEAIKRLLPAAGGRTGLLVEPETILEKRVREAKERKAAGIADVEPLTAEEEDERLIEANPTATAFDGPHGVLVHQARSRIAERREEARKEEAEAAERKRKATWARLTGTK